MRATMMLQQQLLYLLINSNVKSHDTSTPDPTIDIVYYFLLSPSLSSEGESYHSYNLSIHIHYILLILIYASKNYLLVFKLHILWNEEKLMFKSKENLSFN